MKRMMVAAIVAMLWFPYEAQAQVKALAVAVVERPSTADFLLIGGAQFPILRTDRFTAGPALLGGAVFENSDPVRLGKTHAHPTVIVGAIGTFQITKSVGIAAGYGWGWVPKDARNHMQNYRSVLVGLSFGK